MLERRKPPAWFSQRLARAAGLNRFGTPYFDVVWGETATMIHNGVKRLQVPGFQKCWVIREWKPPEVYGTVPMYFYQNQHNFKPITGGYPYRGRYEILQPLCYSGIVNGKLIHRAVPLSSHILTVIMPLLRETRKLNAAQQQIALREIKRREEEAKTKEIADMIQDASPAYKEPVSFRLQGCRTSLIDKKIEQIQRNWQHAMRTVATLGRGGYGVRKLG